MLSGLLPGLIGANGALAGASGRVVPRLPATLKGSQVILQAITPAARRRASARCRSAGPER